MSNIVKFLGHSAFEITTTEKKRILIDPWITGNPTCTITKEELKNPDIILITHDHADHLGQDVPYLSGANTKIIAQPEIITKLSTANIAKDSYLPMNIGGTVETAGVKVTMTQAFHSSTAGSPCGFILTINDKRIYHAGDTGIFSDMKLLGQIYPLDLALLPIGSVYVMDPLQAATALQLLKPKQVIPMHYKTFPVLVQDTMEFTNLAKEKAPEVEVIPISPGESISF